MASLGRTAAPSPTSSLLKPTTRVVNFSPRTDKTNNSITVLGQRVQKNRTVGEFSPRPSTRAQPNLRPAGTCSSVINQPQFAPSRKRLSTPGRTGRCTIELTYVIL